MFVIPDRSQSDLDLEFPAEESFSSGPENHSKCFIGNQSCCDIVGSLAWKFQHHETQS